jgi:hypothetical protein
MEYYEPAGGAPSDVEALYFDDDGQYAYFGIVLSMGPDGYTDRWGRVYEPGDIAIDLDNDATTGYKGYEYSIKTTGPNTGQVCYMPEWTLKHSSYGLKDNAPSTASCDGDASVVVGTADVAYVDTGLTDKGYDNWDGEVDVPNYVIEARVHKNVIGIPHKGDTSDLHVTLTCGNDVVQLNDFEWDYDVPEFGVIAAGLVLVGAGFYIQKRRR